MDTDEPDFPPSGSVKGVLQIPSMTVINSAASIEENTKGHRSGHQRRENINAKSTRIIERRGGGGANRKTYRKEGESSSTRNAKNKDGLRTKEGILTSLLPEDCRISTLLRRLHHENNLEVFFSVTALLKEALSAPENNRYIRRALETIMESLLDILQNGPSSDARGEGARCLGVTGFALEGDVKKYFDWTFTTFRREKRDDAKILLIESLQHMLQLEKDHPKLHDMIEVLLTYLHEALENTDNPDVMWAILDTILLISKIYPKALIKFFTDIVDILIGWHVDPNQPDSVIKIATYGLRELHQYWILEFPFTIGLLSQFLEDMEAFKEDLVQETNFDGDIENSSDGYTHRIMLTIQVFNTVVQCLGSEVQPKEGSPMTQAFWSDSLKRILDSVMCIMEHSNSPELVVATANKSAVILLDALGNQGWSTILHNFFKVQLANIMHYNTSTVVSFCETVSKAIRECGVSLPLEIIGELIGPESSLLELRAGCEKQKTAIISVYHSLLSLKNIPLLQETYSLVLQDLGKAYKVLVKSIEPIVVVTEAKEFKNYDLDEAEMVVLFLLNALIDIARASSIIGMWALKPTIMELLSEHLIPNDEILPSLSPAIQLTILTIMNSHCTRYSSFLSSSSLVKSGSPHFSQESSSPSTGYFTLILKILTDTMSNDNVICQEVILLCLHWSKDLFVQSSSCIDRLLISEQFLKLIDVIISKGSSEVPEVSVAVAGCFSKLLEIIPISTDTDGILMKIAELSVLHVNSLNPLVKACYHEVFLLCPWTHSLKFLTSTDNFQCNISKVVQSVSKIHQNRQNTGDLNSFQFTHLMSYLLHGSQHNIQWLIDTVNLCLIKSPLSSKDDHIHLRTACNLSSKALWTWATWQAAQFTVNSKLRTPLGKPQETFSAFEGAIKSLAREFDTDRKAESSVPKSSIHDMKQARLLIDFLNHLEKCIYNASEGCAIAMSPPSKPARLFFYTNKTVCAEWMSRIRWAVVMVAIHSGMPHVAVRHGFELLYDLMSHQHIPQIEVEKATILLTNALLQLQESEALQGLHKWCSDKTGLKFPWIRAATMQAAERFEDAIQEYSVKEESPLDVLPVYHLAINSDQMSECLMSESNWSQLAIFKTEQDKYCGRYDTLISSAMTLETVKRLSNFEQLNYVEIGGIRSDKIDFDLHKPNKVLAQAIEEFTSISLELKMDQNHRFTSMISSIAQCNKALQSLLEEGIRDNSKIACLDVTILQQVGQALLMYLKEPTSHFCNPFLLDLENMSSQVLRKVLYWNRLFQVISQNKDVAVTYLAASRMARKSGNYNRAKALLTDYWKLKCADTQGFDSLEPNAGVDFKAEKETSKLFYCINKKSESINILAKSVRKFANLAVSEDKEENKQAASDLALTLAKKMAQFTASEKQFNVESLECLNDLLAWADERSACLIELRIQVPDSVGDTYSRQLYQVALETCPKNAKAWGQFAAWSYRQGRKASDWEEDGSSVVVPSENDQKKLGAILGPDTDRNLIASIMAILYERRKTELDDNQLGAILTNMLTARVEEVDKKVAQILAFWSQSSKSHLFYQSAVVAYFNFLRLYDSNVEELTESALTATLRLLRIIVKHATTYQDVLEEGLDSTPTTPWKGIIPQLFSRLNHPESFVRKRLSELLCRLATDAPHLILFPAVVGCSTTGKGVQKNDNLMESFVQDDEDEMDEDDEDEEEPEDVGENSVLRSCFLQMVDTLSQQAPSSISQVRLLVSELRRITVLWDELWLGCLSQHQHDVARRLYQLEVEQKKLQENPTLDDLTKVKLMRQKYNIVMKPVVIVLEQLARLTSVPAETPHEKQFQAAHMDHIAKALEALKNPPLAGELKPQQCWQKFKSLHAKLLKQSQERVFQTLKLPDISPQLAAMKNSAITMPGLSQPMVTIAGIENSVSILPTKTRPKKLAMLGSDGKYYVYLFKGLEDLHLDERIMQFLSIANTMLYSKTGPKYHACYYSVVPLGNRSGLISWVDGVQPIFSLYKRWQIRAATAKQLRQQQISSSTPAVARPSELFYGKLTPLLAEQNVPIENRKEWPLVSLKQVLQALTSETPKDLLAKELWCASSSAADWWTVTKTYARSVAVMSVIGYIIGLGDRHLDNLLINLSTGEIVHIDYNVCFEKGHTLRVPEKVPFRMTQNLQTALGVTGVEGIFRHSCEHVLRTMKYGREPLLTLLEAFVYDPLIDWTPENEAGYTGAVFDGLSQRIEEEVPRPSRKELEKEAAMGMLSVRATEMRVAWQKNKEDLIKARSQLSEKLQFWIATWSEVHKIQTGVQDSHQQMAVLKEAAAVGLNHPIFSLQERSVNFMRVKNALANVEVQLRKTQEEANTNCMRIQSAVISIKSSGDIQLWSQDLKQISEIDSKDLFDLVREFLNSAGQSSVLEQCERLENQCEGIVQQTQVMLRACIDLLSQFGIISSLFTPLQLQCLHTSLHSRLSEELLQNLSAERCRIAMSQLNKHAIRVNLPPSENLVNYQAQLQVATKHSAVRLQEMYKKLDEEPRQLVSTMKEQLVNLAKDNGKVTTMAIIQKLSSMNTSILALEAAASNTGESLVDLTLREGEWFLDKMIQISGLSVELAQALAIIQPHSDLLGNAINCLVVANTVFRDLEELIWNTSSIIAPETVSALTTEEPSVLLMYLGLSELIGSLDKPLHEIAKELEVNLKYLALELPEPHPKTQEYCVLIKAGLANLLRKENDMLSPGQKLLMGFSGMFERLQSDAGKLMTALRNVNIPQAWLSFDQLNKARGLSWTVRKEFSQGLVGDMFLVKMLLVMHDLFTLAHRSAQAFHGFQEIAVSNLISDENLIQPVKRFCADFIRLQLIGLQPESVVVVICSAMEEVLGVNLTELVEQREIGAESRVSLADVCTSVASTDSQRPMAVLNELESCWKIKETFVLAKREKDAAQAYYQQLQLKMTVHAWINDFPQTGRPIFTLNLNKSLRAVKGLQPGLAEVTDQHKILVDNIVQRLKWAAGANPTLAEVLAAFKNASADRMEKLLGLQKLTSKVVSASSGILHLESLRNNTADAVSINNNLLHLLGQCEQNLVVVEAAGPYSLTSAEKSLAKILPLNQAVDLLWLQSAENQVSNQIMASTTLLANEKNKQAAAFSAIKAATAELRAMLTAHHSLMSSVRPLLRTLSKLGEGREALAKYVAKYKNFSEEFSTVVQCLAMEELDPNQGRALLHQLGSLEKMIEPIYHELMEIPSQNQAEDLKRAPLSRQGGVYEYNLDEAPNEDGKQKVPQERNAFAMGVLRRVRAKLEGKDLDPGKAMSVQEQVELIISESTSVDNLCQHYEGWTPWV